MGSSTNGQPVAKDTGDTVKLSKATKDLTKEAHRLLLASVGFGAKRGASFARAGDVLVRAHGSYLADCKGQKVSPEHGKGKAAEYALSQEPKLAPIADRLRHCIACSRAWQWACGQFPDARVASAIDAYPTEGHWGVLCSVHRRATTKGNGFPGKPESLDAIGVLLARGAVMAVREWKVALVKVKALAKPKPKPSSPPAQELTHGQMLASIPAKQIGRYLAGAKRPEILGDVVGVLATQAPTALVQAIAGSVSDLSAFVSALGAASGQGQAEQSQVAAG